MGQWPIAPPILSCTGYGMKHSTSGTRLLTAWGFLALVVVLAISAAGTSASRNGLDGPTLPDCYRGVTDLLGNISMTGREWTDFPRSLSLPAGRYIVDDTGITGLVDLRLTWTRGEPAAADGANDPESLFTALQEQLGLRLVPREAAVPVLIIYSAERPSED